MHDELRDITNVVGKKHQLEADSPRVVKRSRTSIEASLVTAKKVSVPLRPKILVVGPAGLWVHLCRPLTGEDPRIDDDTNSFVRTVCCDLELESCRKTLHCTFAYDPTTFEGKEALENLQGHFDGCIIALDACDGRVVDDAKSTLKLIRSEFTVTGGGPNSRRILVVCVQPPSPDVSHHLSEDKSKSFTDYCARHGKMIKEWAASKNLLFAAVDSAKAEGASIHNTVPKFFNTVVERMVAASPYQKKNKSMRVTLGDPDQFASPEAVNRPEEYTHTGGPGTTISIFSPRDLAIGPAAQQWCRDDFDVGQRLGTGQFGAVYYARERRTGFVCVMKVLYKNRILRLKMAPQVQLEIEVQSHLWHPNILRLYSYFWDEKAVYLLLEYACHGELWDHIQDKGRCSEEEAAGFMKQMVEAIQYCHSKRILHRDIKPENILISDDLCLKLADFGWASHALRPRRTFCGTMEYLAPEVVKRDTSGYRHCADIWGLGVLCYELLVGVSPFQDNDQQQIMNKIARGQVPFPRSMTQGAQDFISQILQQKPQSRATCDQILRHHWLVKWTVKEAANRYLGKSLCSEPLEERQRIDQ
eukprot:GHVL01034990.1.p1 GENE.GHVL01034990.1~~GHVL01034990.1.p1  ORF type:complete len:586 (-),score=80.46 GHVL01034990.1:140-1897(-)